MSLRPRDAFSSSSYAYGSLSSLIFLNSTTPCSPEKHVLYCLLVLGLEGRTGLCPDGYSLLFQHGLVNEKSSRVLSLAFRPVRHYPVACLWYRSSGYSSEVKYQRNVYKVASNPTAFASVGFLLACLGEDL